MFDEQPDGDPHGECAAEIHRLYGALENCWLYAARNRREAWAVPLIRFCTAAGLGSPLRASDRNPKDGDGEAAPGRSPESAVPTGTRPETESAGERLPATPEAPTWHGLTEGERNQAVGALVEYGTGFVAPLYAVIEGVERKLMERNAATPSPSPQAPQVERLDVAELRELSDAMRTKANNNTHVKSSTLVIFAAEISAIADRLAGGGSTPQAAAGWQAVPVEPTEAMRTAAEREFLLPAAFDARLTWADKLSSVYRAMLAAAPTLPTQELTPEDQAWAEKFARGED